MKMSRSFEQQPRMGRGNVLKAAALGLVGAVVFAIAVVNGYQAEKQVSQQRPSGRRRTQDVKGT